MSKEVSEWIEKARKRWPRSYKAKEIHGDGRYAVLTCAFQHPSAHQMMYSEVNLYETHELALKFKAGLDDASNFGMPYCHAKTKGMCRGQHLLVDLATFQEEK